MKYIPLVLSIILSSTAIASQNQGIFAHINTNKGEIIVNLEYKKAPLTVINFVSLAEGTKVSNKELGIPFYDGITFHRVIKDFMIQAGDPKGNGTGGSGYTFIDEFSDLKHNKAGILSMANSGANTNSSQFFITHISTPWLDNKHSVFGSVVSGMDVVNNIAQGDIINSIKINKIGADANKFATGEKAFNNQLAITKNAIAQNKKVAEQIFKNKILKAYPKAIKNKYGYFYVTEKKSKLKKPIKNQQVSFNLATAILGGAILEKSKKTLVYEIGKNQLPKIIEEILADMRFGEKRTTIFKYKDIYTTNNTNIPADSIVLVKIELLSN